MRGLLRYRQIPLRWVARDSKRDDIPDPPVRIVPVIVFPQPDRSYGEVMADSSPQIMLLEAEFSGRSIVPRRKTTDYDQWIGGMNRLHQRLAGASGAGRGCRSGSAECGTPGLVPKKGAELTR